MKLYEWQCMVCAFTWYEPAKWDGNLDHGCPRGCDDAGDMIGTIEVEKNTLLQEAAPDLLEACKMLNDRIGLGRVVARGVNRVKSYEIKAKKGEDLREIIKIFKRAVTKAKGEVS